MLLTIVAACELLGGWKLDRLTSACVLVKAHLFAAFFVTLALALVLIDSEVGAGAVVNGQFARGLGRLALVDTIVLGSINA